MATSDNLKVPTLFNGNFIELRVDGLAVGSPARLTTSNKAWVYDHDFREFKMLEIMISNGGTDGNTHRISQILPVYWLEHIIIPNLNEENGAEYGYDISYRKFLYNFCRSADCDRRCFIWFSKNNFNTINTRRVSSTSVDKDTYDIIVRGFY